MKPLFAAVALGAALVATSGADAKRVKLDISATSPVREAPAITKGGYRRHKGGEFVAAAAQDGFRPHKCCELTV